MKFIRKDGIIYDQSHEDTIKRLQKSDRFEAIDNLTVEQLKDYARKREVTGFSTMTKDKLIKSLKEGV